MYNKFDNIYLFIPLAQAVSDAIIDTYEDPGRSEERYTRWAVRVVRRLNNRTLKTNKHYAKISIDLVTNTIKLPPDLKSVIWQGVIDKDGKKVHIPLMGDLWPTEQQGQYSNCCDLCGQSKEVCEALTTEIRTEILPPQEVGYPYCGDGIGFDQIEWVKVEKRKLLPSGTLIIEISTPVWDPVTKIVTTETVKYIETVELLNCGCPAPTRSNQTKLSRCCDAWELIISGCCDDLHEKKAGIEYFLEAGYAKVYGNPNTKYIWLEYAGDIPKKNGKYVIPEIALEAVVAGIKVMANADKKNVPMQEKLRLEKDFNDKVREMKREIGPKITIDDIYELIRKPARP